MKNEHLWYACCALFVIGFIGVMASYFVFRARENRLLPAEFYYFAVVMIGGAFGCAITFMNTMMQYLNYYGR